MLKMLKMTLLPCLLLVGLQPLPANGQSKDTPPYVPPYFASVQITEGTCKQYTITMLDSSKPAKTAFYREGKAPLPEMDMMSMLTSGGFDQKRDTLHKSPFPCEFAGTGYTEPNQGNPVGDPDKARRAQAILTATAVRARLMNPAASQNAQQTKPILKPIAPREAKDRLVAPPQNTGVRQPTQTVPRP